MRKVLIDSIVSLDGFFTSPKNEIDWFQFDEQSLEWSREILRSAGTVVMGRVTFELLAQFWPTPAAFAEEPAIAGHLKELPKLVFSRSLATSDWANTQFEPGDPVPTIRKLKEGSGKDVVVLGSSRVVSDLLRAGLLDELKVRIQPVVLGKGRPLFAEQAERHPLRHLETRSFTSGVVAIHYAVLGASKPA